MTVVVVFHGHIFIPASSENALIGDNIQCFMLCLLANSTMVRWLSYVVCTLRLLLAVSNQWTGLLEWTLTFFFSSPRANYIH